MEVNIVSKSAFTVIGIEGRGLSAKGPEWVRPLWDNARSHVSNVQDLIGPHAWGLMSAVDEPFGRWREEGKYLAGWEVEPEIKSPSGWTSGRSRKPPL
jgi:hypothetical protein